jgi:branched-chain amino acid transport system permease protein
MRFIFKTDHDQDIRLAKHGGHVFWYGLLGVLLLLAPLMLKGQPYLLGQLTFILIYSIVGVGLMLIVGFTGLLSLGHAAFFGVGAYTQAVMINAGLPFPVALVSAGLLAASVGVIVGLPVLRLKGLYLAIATLALAFIVEEIFARWESVTGGNMGLKVKPPVFLSIEIDEPRVFYYVCLLVTVLCTLVIINILRSPTGRAFVAIRDSEISAQSMGIHLALYKTMSFAISAAMAGIGGALYAHGLTFLSPDQFGLVQAIDFLLMIVIGGLGYIHGAFLGAIFLITMPEIISNTKHLLPDVIGKATGLKAVVFSAVLVAIVLFEPMGLYGRWLKIRTWLELFPTYRRGMFKRQKTFQKSDRLK